jgi:outer membrane protein assembly factor BamE (lipoprotein component of BamABCDE complex)
MKPLAISSLRIFALCLALLAASACTPIVAKRGNAIEDAQLQQIVVGQSTREDVARILGTPTQTGTFDDKSWYYVGQRTEQEAFFDPELKEQTLVTIDFTPEGKVASVRKRGAELAQKIDPVDRKTPTYGKEMSLMQQLIGNLGKPSIPAPNKGK